MSPLIPIALGAGALYVLSGPSKGAKAEAAASAAPGRQALDPGMDSTIAESITLAINQETDPSVLTQFASALSAAGYKNSADAVTAAAQKAGK